MSLPEQGQAKRHPHTFTALWTTFGQHGPQAVHYHVCEDQDCARVLVGRGRDCNGNPDDHWRETLR